MGVDLFDVLRGIVLLGDMRIVSKPDSTADAFPEVGAVTAGSLDDYPTLLKATGTLKGFIHKPQVDPSVRPVQQKF